MPNISASDYTTFLKFKAAAASPIRPAIQTRTNATLSQSVLNANILASQAAFLIDPFITTRVTIPTTVSGVSNQTVTTARSIVIATAVGNGSIITYTTSPSQPHGLVTGDIVTIRDVAGFSAANVTAQAVTVASPGSSTFTVAVAATGTATAGTGRIVGRVYYTTSVAHGLLPGEIVSITNVNNFSITNATVLASPSATTFVLSNTATNIASTAQEGTIVGRMYYTTAAAHGLGLTASNQYVTITGITAHPEFNVERGTIISVPSSTVFVLQGSGTGNDDAESGTIVLSTFKNPNVAISGLSSVRPMPPNNVNNPNVLSTLSWTSGTSGSVGSTTSSKFVQPGGLPASGRVGPTNYTRLPQNAGWIQGNTVSSGPKRF